MTLSMRIIQNLWKYCILTEVVLWYRDSTYKVPLHWWPSGDPSSECLGVPLQQVIPLSVVGSILWQLYLIVKICSLVRMPTKSEVSLSMGVAMAYWLGLCAYKMFGCWFDPLPVDHGWVLFIVNHIINIIICFFSLSVSVLVGVLPWTTCTCVQSVK